jgi:uncharacterized membrane protein
MKRVLLVVTATVLFVAGLLAGTVFAWSIWVMVTGGSWLLEFMFDSKFLPILVVTICVGLMALLNLWVASKVFRKSRMLVQSA